MSSDSDSVRVNPLGDVTVTQYANSDPARPAHAALIDVGEHLRPPDIDAGQPRRDLVVANHAEAPVPWRCEPGSRAGRT